MRADQITPEFIEAMVDRIVIEITDKLEQLDISMDYIAAALMDDATVIDVSARQKRGRMGESNEADVNEGLGFVGVDIVIRFIAFAMKHPETILAAAAAVVMTLDRAPGVVNGIIDQLEDSVAKIRKSAAEREKNKNLNI